MTGQELHGGVLKAMTQLFSNRLLASLDPAGADRLRSMLTIVSLEAEQVLYHPGQRINDIYFPETCVISMLSVMRNGDAIESATVGREGASWISASFQSPIMPCQTTVAITGDAYRLSADAVEREIRQNGNFHNALSHYSHALLIQVLRATACNGLHSMEQRCSRWILGTLDRVDLDRFAITQEFLARLLGVQRTGVNHVIGRVLFDGMLIKGERGQIRLGDRKKLEQVSCECYNVMKEQFC
jgi:CRP-like cAMP-binding protein